MRPVRRDFISRHLAVKRSSLLEIGAMDSPTFPDRDAKYLDWFSREELQAAIAGNPNRLPERVVAPDYVVKEKRFAAQVGERFDAVIANHVIEHIADPIAWLEEVGKLVTDEGSLFLTVPDRRFTFDYVRPVSTAPQLMRAHLEDLQRPSRWQALESLFHWRPIRAADVWDGGYEEKLKRRRFTLDEAWHASAKAEREYVDVHCHVFTFDRFGSLIEDLADGGFIGWRIGATRDVEPGGNEFYAWLRRGERR
jgi:SAM-dependent methyltransferase